MEQKQRLDYLVEKFKEDSGEYSDLAVPDSEPEKRRILRSLMNIRMPRHLDAEVQEVPGCISSGRCPGKRNRDSGPDSHSKRQLQQQRCFCRKNLYLAGRHYQTSGGSYCQCCKLPDAGVFCFWHDEPSLFIE